MGDEYDTIFRQCVSLSTELHKLMPLAKPMHLLPLNTATAAWIAQVGNRYVEM
jgi:hypothetical protein